MMYFRQCWKETRMGFLIAVALMVLLALHCARLAVPAPSFVAAMKIRSPKWTWTWEAEWVSGSRMFSYMGSPLVFLMGLGLGASGFGNHASRGLHEFLFTRPRRRWHFTWGSWAVGVSQILLTVLIAATVLVSTLAVLTHHFLISSVLEAVLQVALPALVIFSVSQWMTALTRNPRNGIIYSAAGCVGYLAVVAFVYYRMHPPHLAAILASLISVSWMRDGRFVEVPLPYTNWMTITYQSLLVLVFALLTQRTVERMDA